MRFGMFHHESIQAVYMYSREKSILGILGSRMKKQLNSLSTGQVNEQILSHDICKVGMFVPRKHPSCIHVFSREEHSRNSRITDEKTTK